MMKRILLFLCMAGVSYADAPPASTPLANGCREFVMCDAQSATGVCTSENGDEISQDLGGYYHLTLMTQFATTTSGTYSCQLVVSGEKHDNGGSAVNTPIVNAVVTQSDSLWSGEGMFFESWMTCSAAGGVTVKLRACPASR